MAAATDQPLVRNYLRQLELATARLPRQQANELLSQIKTHLEDSLDPSSTAEDTAEVIRRLGTPSELVAEQQALFPTPNAGLRRVTGRLRVVHLWTWIITALVLVVTVPTVAIWIDMRTTPALQSWSGSMWWYPQDSSAATYTSTLGTNETTIPWTTQRQTGWVFEIYNPSRYTQRLVTTDLSANIPGYGPGLQVSIANLSNPDQPFLLLTAKYTAHGSIPPHHWGAIRVLWTPDFCEGAGGPIVFTSLEMTVHVGWMDRTQTISFPEGFGLSFPKNYSPTGPGIAPCSP